MKHPKPILFLALCGIFMVEGCLGNNNIDSPLTSTQAISATPLVIEPTATDWMIDYDTDNPTFLSLRPTLQALWEKYLDMYSKPGWFHITRKVDNYLYQFCLDQPDESVCTFPEGFFDTIPPKHIWEGWYELDEDGLRTGTELHIYYHADETPNMVVLELADPLITLKFFLNENFEPTVLIPEEYQKMSASTGISIEPIDLAPVFNLQNYQTKRSGMTISEGFYEGNKSFHIAMKTPYDSTLCSESPYYSENICGTVLHYDINLENGYPYSYVNGKYGESGEEYVELRVEITAIETVTAISAEADILLQKMEALIP